ncbi:MAG TPA: hypothetical protein VF244_05840 [Acidimicrobiales bacterium]
MGPDSIRRCGWAAVAGGAMWAAKGAAILATGDQPPVLFELPLLLFPLGLLGLHARLEGHDGRLRSVGRGVSLVALVAGAVAAGVFVVDPDASGAVPGIAIAGSALGTVVGLILLGLVARRAQIFPPPWHRLPFVMGVATPVLLSVVGGMLSEINERLLEVPLVLVAAAWIRLGLLIADLAPAVNGPKPPSRRA